MYRKRESEGRGPKAVRRHDRDARRGKSSAPAIIDQAGDTEIHVFIDDLILTSAGVDMFGVPVTSDNVQIGASPNCIVQCVGAARRDLPIFIER